MKHLNTVRMKKDFSSIIEEMETDKERVILTRHGKEVIALVPVEDAKLLEEIEDRMDMEAARKALKEEGTIPWEKVKAELGL